MRRLQELITKEERQVKVDIEARAEGLRRQRKRQAVERSDLERRHEAEMLLMANNQARSVEKKCVDESFIGPFSVKRKTWTRHLQTNRSF